jgi:hypothetical protein
LDGNKKKTNGEREANRAGEKLSFEDYMSRKKGTGVPERGGRQTRTQDQTKSQNVKGTIAKGREGHMVRKPPLEQGRKNNQSDILNDKLEPPREQSLENIFAMEVETNTQLRNSSTQPLLIDTNLTDQVIYTRDVQPDRTDRINVGYNDIDVNRQGANASGIGNSKLGNLPMSTVMTVEEGLSKNIRGRFKREVYGEDELKKRENQSRMKRELEQQMNQNKIKKENEKRRKDEDDRIEHERVQRYQAGGGSSQAGGRAEGGRGQEAEGDVQRPAADYTPRIPGPEQSGQEK